MKTYHLMTRDGMFVDNVEKTCYKHAREYFELKFSGKYRIEHEVNFTFDNGRNRSTNVVFK